MQKLPGERVLAENDFYVLLSKSKFIVNLNLQLIIYIILTSGFYLKVLITILSIST